jgi:hypothetical protein
MDDDDGGLQWWQEFGQFEEEENERLPVHQQSAGSTEQDRHQQGSDLSAGRQFQVPRY